MQNEVYYSIPAKKEEFQAKDSNENGMFNCYKSYGRF